MAQAHNHVVLIHDFLEWMRHHSLLSITDLSTQESTSFIPVDDARAYLGENYPPRLAGILDEVFHSFEPPVDWATILSNYVAIFCILLEMGKGSFIQKFVKYRLNDQKLPFDPRQEPPLGFPSDTHARSFYGWFCKIQWRFCVPLFHKNMAKVFPEDQILPIASIQNIAHGGSGCITRSIRLHSSYNLLAGHTAVV
jgi:hypothetical protein